MHDHPRSCASCGELHCTLSYAHRKKETGNAITAFILDDVWPEHADYVRGVYKEGDQIIAPGIMGRGFPARYGWPARTRHEASLATLLRHCGMRRVRHKNGALRQQTYLDGDRRLAQALAGHIDYRAGHLVIYQAFLPWLDALGVFGGRSFDVLMTQYPLQLLHDKLDDMQRRYPDSKTARYFRAPEGLVERESDALARAQKIITPHHDIAAHYADKAVITQWRMPAAKHAATGERTAFPGPTIARQGAYEAREIARSLKEPLIVFGENHEAENFWNGISIERREFGRNWLDGIGCIIHPAIATNQPRRLLEAAANGVRIYATKACGLPDTQYLPLESFRK
jgi:hypothetical protein